MDEIPPAISVVIPSFKRRKEVIRLLKDIFDQKEASYEVIVVDDFSADGSAELISRQFPDVKLIQNEQNLGPAVSRNRGILRARGGIIVGFDSDVAIRDHYILSKVKSIFDQKPKVSGLAFRLLRNDGTKDDIDRWWHPKSVDEFSEKEFQTSYFSGTAYAFRRVEMVSAGLFPEVFFMHYEEVELAWRILDNHGHILYVPTLQVVHLAAATSGRNRVQVFYKPRNQVLLAIRCLPIVRAVFYAAPRLIYNGLIAVFRNHLRDYIAAIWSSILLAPKCFSERKPISSSTWSRIARLKYSFR